MFHPSLDPDSRQVLKMFTYAILFSILTLGTILFMAGFAHAQEPVPPFSGDWMAISCQQTGPVALRFAIEDAPVPIASITELYAPPVRQIPAPKILFESALVTTDGHTMLEITKNGITISLLHATRNTMFGSAAIYALEWELFFRRASTAEPIQEFYRASESACSSPSAARAFLGIMNVKGVSDAIYYKFVKRTY